MAGVQSLKEEILTCAICREIYTNPCTLGCHHSFCRKCVTDYIQTRPDAVQSKTIPCAFCQQDTRVPNPTRPVQEWAKQINPSLMLQRLIDRLQKHEKGRDDCFFCGVVRETTLASYWCLDCEVKLCDRCVNMHRSGPTTCTKKHYLFDLSGGANVIQRRKVKCITHEGELIKYICKDCNTTASQISYKIKHRACKHVVYIRSMMLEIKSVLATKRQSLEKEMKENIARMKKEESRIEQLANMETKTTSEIKSTIENIIALLRKKEEDLLKELKDKTGKYIAQLQAHVMSGQIANQMYQQQCEFIVQVVQSVSVVDMYDMYQVCQSGAVDCVEATIIYRPVVGEVTFTLNMEPVRKVISEMGRIHSTEPAVSRKRPDDVQSKTIPCAFTQQDTRVPNPTRPVQEWAKQFKRSIIIQGLMDRLQTGQKHGKGEDVCFFCGEVGDCEVTLCGRCVKKHCIGPPTKKHDLFDLSGGANVKQRRKVKCITHEEKLIKFICKDCNTTACQTCCIIKHRACKDVVTIESMIPEIKSVLATKRQSLEKEMKENIARMKKEESRIEQLTNMETKTTSEIKSTIENIIALLRKKEEDLLKELKDKTGKYIAQLQAHVMSGQIANQMYQQQCEFIVQVVQSVSVVDMYDMYQVCQSGAVDCVEATIIYRPVVGEVTFTLNMEPVQKVVSEMGRIHSTEPAVSRKRPDDVQSKTIPCAFTQQDTRVPNPTRPVQEWAKQFKPSLIIEPAVSRKRNQHGPYTLSTPVLHDTIDIEPSQDAGTPYPIDVTVLTVNSVETLVVADWMNCSLKSETSTLKLPGSPYSVAKMTGNMVAVTVDNSHIVVAEVRPELVLISNFKTCKQYFGITPLTDSTLAVGSELPPGVDIIDLRGILLRSFTPFNTGPNPIQWPRYLCTTHEGNILVSDTKSMSVYCLTSKGGVVFTYPSTGDRALRDPRGITVTDIGDILLVDRGSRKILQLSSDGKYVRDVLTPGYEVHEPRGLCIDVTNKIYVCEIIKSKSSERCIKVFKFV